MPRHTSIAVVVALIALGACADDGPMVAVVSSESDPPQQPAQQPGAAVAADAVAVVGDVTGVEAVDDDVDEPAELVSGRVARFRPTTVAVVGDSLALSASPEIAEALERAGLEVIAIDALESRRMASGGSSLPPGVDAIDAILAGDELPDLWVIALGTNDVGAQASVDRFRADMGELVGLVPDDAPIVWVDLWIRDRNEATVEANEQIRSVLRRRFGVSIVVDWYSHGLDPATITGDGVHLTETGRARFADAIVGAIDTFFPGD